MSAYYQIGFNREGLSVRVDIAPKPVTEAAERFAARCIEEDHGFGSPCRVWRGSANFNMGDGRVVNYKRAALELAERELSPHQSLKSLCGTPRCCNISHFFPCVTAQEL